MQTQKVVQLDWRSLDGAVEFRPRYSDGSLGPVERTGIETNENRRLAARLAAIEKVWIGRAKPA